MSDSCFSCRNWNVGTQICSYLTSWNDNIQVRTGQAFCCIKWTKKELEIKDCPFCGSQGVAYYNEQQKSHRISCKSCSCSTASYSTVEAAVEWWNKRK